jgi:aspartate aminotransferase-like enzyme
MGHAARHTNVLLCLTALADTLRSMGAVVNADAAVAAAKSVYT